MVASGVLPRSAWSLCTSGGPSVHRNPFSASEIAARQARVREALGRRGLAAAVFAAPETVFWLTGLDHWGYFAPHLLLVTVEGRPVHTKEIAAICRLSGLSAELGGGLRSMEAVKAALDLGVSRVVIGTAAFDADFLHDLCGRFPGKVVVGIDARGQRLHLLRVLIENLADVGSVVPLLGGAGVRYDPLPAQLTSRRRRLTFVYHDGSTVQMLDFVEASALVDETGASRLEFSPRASAQ